MYSRRSLLRALAAAAAVGTVGTGASLTRHLRAATTVTDRKFLFFFASGGWDATPLDPKYGEDGVSAVSGTDMDPDTYLETAGNLSWSGGADRENMTTFFQRWGAWSALIRGVDVHSAGHDSGMKWMMTGTSASSTPDWPTILAANGRLDYPMPHLVFSGPAYPGTLGSAVIRGGGGVLLDLIDGDVLGQADAATPVVPTPMDTMMDALVRERALKFAATRPDARADALVASLERAMELEGRRFEAGLGDTGSTVLDQSIMALELMRLGLTRCAMINIPGGWDTHGGNQGVGPQLHDFFGALDQIMDYLVSTPGTVARRLFSEVTIVCASELGRTPILNGSQGRDHWPYTSCMAIGSGIRGDTVLGRTDDGFIAQPIDLSTGQASDSGSIVATENLGTALLQLGGLDPEQWLPGVEPLTALLESTG